MSEEQVSTAARLNAERLMSGRRITDDEMRVIIAGLMLSVDKLANSFGNMEKALWTEAQMREMIAQEVKKHCAENKRSCFVTAEKPESTGGFAAWCGRMVRAIIGG